MSGADETSRQKAAEAIKATPRWKKVVIGGATVLLVSGLALATYESSSDARSPTSGDLISSDIGRPLTGNSLVDDSNRIPLPPTWPRPNEHPPASESAPDDGEWSPAMVRGGFGFFVGFAVGLTLRMFFRISMIFVGLNLLALISLSHLGWLEVRWDIMQEQFDHWSARFGEEFSEVKTLVAGSLPTVGLSGLGIFTGFRKG